LILIKQLELPAEAVGYYHIKAEEGDAAVQWGAVVCLIDTS
jgi:hypothetical protein